MIMIGFHDYTARELNPILKSNSNHNFNLRLIQLIPVNSMKISGMLTQVVFPRKREARFQAFTQPYLSFCSLNETFDTRVNLRGAIYIYKLYHDLREVGD